MTIQTTLIDNADRTAIKDALAPLTEKITIRKNDVTGYRNPEVDGAQIKAALFAVGFVANAYAEQGHAGKFSLWVSRRDYAAEAAKETERRKTNEWLTDLEAYDRQRFVEVKARPEYGPDVERRVYTIKELLEYRDDRRQRWQEWVIPAGLPHQGEIVIGTREPGVEADNGEMRYWVILTTMREDGAINPETVLVSGEFPIEVRPNSIGYCVTFTAPETNYSDFHGIQVNTAPTWSHEFWVNVTRRQTGKDQYTPWVSTVNIPGASVTAEGWAALKNEIDLVIAVGEKYAAALNAVSFTVLE